MSHDSQHLEFLISQYVDNVLDAQNRKFVEQQLAADPAARELLKEHREAQDLLDDYGSRIPMINWGEFDAKLMEKLGAETKSAPILVRPWVRWVKPAAIAASLLIAAGLGYGWHAYQRPIANNVAVNPGATPVVAPAIAKVSIADMPGVNESVGHASVAENVMEKLAGQVVVDTTSPNSIPGPEVHPTGTAFASPGTQPFNDPR